jgi:hypothetical protein
MYVIAIWLSFLLITFSACGESNTNPVDEYGDTLINALDKAEITTLKVNLRTIRMEIDRFRAERGRLPESLEELHLQNISTRHYDYDSETGEVEVSDTQ